tara:strand:+ start:277 stop:1338 length:1062 start_codon:yes stop_codon:yes gene_type:complete
MKRFSATGHYLLLAFACNLFGEPAQKPVDTITFGSCAKQYQPQPIWDSILQLDPDLFVFLGDNIYGDTQDMEKLRAKYQQLGAIPGFQQLRKHCPILATWDDHDYGRNDAGAEFPMKKQSRDIFLDFFGEPPDSPRRKHPGVYDSKTYGAPGKRIQFILLDTRYFRGPLNKVGKPRNPNDKRWGPYLPSKDKASTILGEAQWAWLEKKLQEPAELRILASSIQVISDQHGWECWGNLPHERDRLYNLLRKTRANGVIILSGDRHQGEISRMTDKLPYPLHDITASGMNWRGRPVVEKNPYRIGPLYREEHFGAILIDWKKSDPSITLQIRNLQGQTISQTQTSLQKLQFPDKK